MLMREEWLLLLQCSYRREVAEDRMVHMEGWRWKPRGDCPYKCKRLSDMLDHGKLSKLSVLFFPLSSSSFIYHVLSFTCIYFIALPFVLQPSSAVSAFPYPAPWDEVKRVSGPCPSRHLTCKDEFVDCCRKFNHYNKGLSQICLDSGLDII